MDDEKILILDYNENPFQNLLCNFEMIEFLSLNHCNLKSLNEMPFFPNLYKLELNYNAIEDFSPLSQYLYLSQLSILGSSST